MSKHLVIGSGPASLSYLVAALEKSPHDSFILIEKNDKIAPRIFVSGNGRANIFNESLFDRGNNCYMISNKMTNYPFSLRDEEDFKEFIGKLGIDTMVEEGRHYPFSNTAKSVVDAFYSLLKKPVKEGRLQILLSTNVLDIDTSNDLVITSKEKFHYDKLFFGIGGISYDREEHSILSCLGQNTNPMHPALGPVRPDFTWPTKLVGCRLRGRMTIFYRNTPVFYEDGELLFKENTLSGIMMFNASLFTLHEKHNFIIDIDLTQYKGNRVKEPDSLDSYLPPKIIDAIDSLPFKSGHLRFTLKRGPTYKESQVTSGGIKLDSVDQTNFSLKGLPKVKVGGEALDVAGICGGYNIAWAFFSGYKAGKY